MSVREGVRTRTRIMLYKLTEAELQDISTKYCLAIRKDGTSCWVTLEIPEANTEIVWFRRYEEEA